MKLTYHPDAEGELVEAVRFYEGREPGLGSRFLRDFDAAIAAILAAPYRWRVVEDDVRRLVMRRFPYGIYYRQEGDDIRILVVKHHSRHPDYWKYRLGS
ncbi:MAG TPA: type II toxin-antitoxin system RelE/ParE family toxin [Thermoanaerobaculia bacterium]|nr:type II toxin-antitoxin system RelE/ParE family toxin [Thermoanaerobaculia bacterium]